MSSTNNSDMASPHAAFTAVLHKFLIDNGISQHIVDILDGERILQSVRELEAATPPPPPPTPAAPPTVMAPAPSPSPAALPPAMAPALSPYPAAPPTPAAPLPAMAPARSPFPAVSPPGMKPASASAFSALLALEASVPYIQTAAITAFLTPRTSYIPFWFGAVCVSLFRISIPRPTAAKTIGQFALELLGEETWKAVVRYYAGTPEGEKAGDTLESVKLMLCVICEEMTLVEDGGVLVGELEGMLKQARLR